MELQVLDPSTLEERRSGSRASAGRANVAEKDDSNDDITENTGLLTTRGQMAVVGDSTQGTSTTLSLVSSKMSTGERLRSMSVLTYVFICLFAVSSWIDINGLYVELPLLVSELPEGWNLPSYIIVIIQVANIGPLAYTIAHKVAPTRIREWPVVYLIIAIGAASCLLLTFFWDHTSYVGGAKHSTALIALTASLALVDCTSSVVYLPYMASFKPQYMTALYIGEGLSGLIPGSLGLIQGSGSEPQCINSSVVNSTTNDTDYVIIPVYKPPLFSVEVFFFFLFGMMCVSGLSFTLLHFLPRCRAERIKAVTEYCEQPKTDATNVTAEKTGHCNGTDVVPASTYGGVENSTAADHCMGSPTVQHLGVKNSADTVAKQTRETNHCVDAVDPVLVGRLNNHHYALLVIVTALVNSLTNGLLPSTQSYSALPYGNTPYTLAVRISTIANPIACFIALFLPTSSVLIVMLLTLCGMLLSTYQLFLAALSPLPPFMGHPAGDILVVATAVLLVGVFSYVKVTLATMFHNNWGRRGLLGCGVATQIGSFVGAITAFIIVNVLDVFVSSQPCG